MVKTPFRYMPELPKPTYREPWLHGQERAMADEQYAQYLKESGQLAAQYVSNFQWNLVTPAAGDIARVKQLIVLARQRTKARLIREWGRR